jgi:hypothetical protein
VFCPTVDVNATLTFFGGLSFVSIIVADISILYLLASSFTPLLLCVPPPSLPEKVEYRTS